MQSIGTGLYFLLMILRKCFGHIKSPDDEQSLQNDWYNLAFWSITSHVFFNPSKSTHVSFNQKFLHYITSEVANPTNTTHSHKDLRVIISDSLNWNIHHDAILSKAYRTLGLV